MYNNNLRLPPDDISMIADTTSEYLLGNRYIYDVNPLNDNYNETFLNNNHGPLLLHLALSMYAQHNNAAFDDMQERMKRIVLKSLETYPFSSQEEELEVKNGVLVAKKATVMSDRQNSLYKMRATGNESWELNPKHLGSLGGTDSTINFFTYIYSSFFKVDRTQRKHFIAALPNINFPSVILEAYVYIKSLTAEYVNLPSCKIQLNNYNKYMHKRPSSDFYSSDEGIVIDYNMDKRAKSRMAYENLLYIYLAFPICCEDNDTIWETLEYDKLYKIIWLMLNDKEKYKGRLTNSIIFDDLKKSQSLLLKGSVDYSDAIQVTDASKKDIIEEITFLMGTNISNDLWEQTKDLPDDWISLL